MCQPSPKNPGKGGKSHRHQLALYWWMSLSDWSVVVYMSKTAVFFNPFRPLVDLNTMLSCVIQRWVYVSVNISTELVTWKNFLPARQTRTGENISMRWQEAYISMPLLEDVLRPEASVHVWKKFDTPFFLLLFFCEVGWWPNKITVWPVIWLLEGLFV